MDRPELYDLTLVKQHESFHNPEVVVRIVLISACVLMLVVWYDQPLTLLGLWWIAYIACLLAVFGIVRALPPQIRPQRRFGLVAVYLLDASAYAALPLWLWWQEDVSLRIFALFLLFAGMLHAVALRSMTQLRRLTNAVFVLVGMIAMVGMCYLHDESLRKLIGLGTGMFAIYLYFCFAVYQSVSSARKVQEATNQRVNAERNAAIGALTGGIAHDFNNLLTVIMGNIELAQETDDRRERQQLLEEAHTAGARGAELTSHLLSFSRKSVLQPEPVDLLRLVERNLSFWRRVLPSDIWIETDHQRHDLPILSVDPVKFETMLMNLVLNARDAMREGGSIKISTAYDEDAGKITLTIADSGEGIPKDILDRVTEPFFTTKTVGQGAGLGLSMAQGFVEQSNGAMTIRSDVGYGTTVVITFPAVGQASAVDTSASKTKPIDEPSRGR